MTTGVIATFSTTASLTGLAKVPADGEHAAAEGGADEARRPAATGQTDRSWRRGSAPARGRRATARTPAGQLGGMAPEPIVGRERWTDAGAVVVGIVVHGHGSRR